MSFTTNSTTINNKSKSRFHLTVLGCSGGPLDNQTCGYLLKSSSILYSDLLSTSTYNRILCVDAGSGLSSVNEIILNELYNFLSKEPQSSPYYRLLNSYSCNPRRISEYTSCLIIPFGVKFSSGSSSYVKACQLLDLANKYLLTHPHLDHIAALIVNSAGFLKFGVVTTESNEESMAEQDYLLRQIFCNEFTIDALRKHIFNGIIWPNLECSKNGKLLNFEKLESYEQSSLGNFPKKSSTFRKINDDFEVVMFDSHHGIISDGSTSQLEGHTYPSSAFLLRLASAGTPSYLLIFGDLEPHSKQNSVVWSFVAPLIANQLLSGILVECSTTNKPSSTPLFGHLTPELLISELNLLADQVDAIQLSINPSKRRLEGLQVLITHIKEDCNIGDKVDPRWEILTQLKSLNKKYQLGCEFTVVFPGLTYEL